MSVDNAKAERIRRKENACELLKFRASENHAAKPFGRPRSTDIPLLGMATPPCVPKAMPLQERVASGPQNKSPDYGNHTWKLPNPFPSLTLGLWPKCVKNASLWSAEFL